MPVYSFVDDVVDWDALGDVDALSTTSIYDGRRHMFLAAAAPVPVVPADASFVVPAASVPVVPADASFVVPAVDWRKTA